MQIQAYAAAARAGVKSNVSLLPHDIAVDEFADRWSAAQVRAEVDRLIESFESNPSGAEYFAGNAPSTEMKRANLKPKT